MSLLTSKLFSQFLLAAVTTEASGTEFDADNDWHDVSESEMIDDDDDKNEDMRDVDDGRSKNLLRDRNSILKPPSDVVVGKKSPSPYN